MNVMQKLMAVGLIILLFGSVFFVGLWGWNVTRQIHYSLSYRSMVENTVRDMVKPEALKSPPTEGKRQ